MPARVIGKWLGATVAAVAVALVSWGVAGVIDRGCGPSRRGGCGVPEGGGGYFAALMICPWAFAVVGKKVPLLLWTKGDGRR
ncbi:hypothetical protein ACFY41_27990 [Streptomyces syringium]|uniref:hypothetical protein n=1 Tax=Streptomyces syringium TaxID=76729 RepID=UPI0036B3CC9C